MADKTTPGAPTLPLCLDLDEAKRDIVAAVNKATARGIPCFLLEPILHEIFGQVSAHANNERQKAKELYNKQLAEYAAKEKNTAKDAIKNGGAGRAAKGANPLLCAKKNAPILGVCFFA
jgi:hypothetical protein